MVKLFIGNLSEGVGSERLVSIFSQHVPVQECDVLKSYAFVHVENEKDADIAIEKMNKYKLDGKEIHVERSTSHLRKQPGMGDKCFTCGDEEHKTSQCPKNPNRKRNHDHPPYEPLIKKPRPLLFSNIQTMADEYRMQQQQAAAHQQIVQQQQPTNCWGYKVAGSADADPELPCPQNPELYRLYEQYMESRTRYFFYREQLSKEMRLQPQATMAGAPDLGGTTGNDPSIIRVDLTNFVRTNGQSAPIITSRSLIAEHQQQKQQQQQPLFPAQNSQPNPQANLHYSSLIPKNNAPLAPAAQPQPIATANPYSAYSTTTNFLQQSAANNPPNIPPSMMPPHQPNSMLPPPHQQQLQHPQIKNEPAHLAMETFGGAHHHAAPFPNPNQPTPNQAFQSTYSGAATHYSTTAAFAPHSQQQPPIRHMAPPQQPAAAHMPKHPTPLSAIQPFGYNLPK